MCRPVSVTCRPVSFIPWPLLHVNHFSTSVGHFSVTCRPVSATCRPVSATCRPVSATCRPRVGHLSDIDATRVRRLRSLAVELVLSDCGQILHETLEVLHLAVQAFGRARGGQGFEFFGAMGYAATWENNTIIIQIFVTNIKCIFSIIVFII